MQLRLPEIANINCMADNITSCLYIPIFRSLVRWYLGKWNPLENLDMLTPHLVISRSCKKLGHLLTWQQPGKENKTYGSPPKTDRALFSKKNFQKSLLAVKPTHKKKNQTTPPNERQSGTILNFVSGMSMPGMRCHQKREDRLSRPATLLLTPCNGEPATNLPKFETKTSMEAIRKQNRQILRDALPTTNKKK
ncbi:hypothetical protein YC2023_050744 [Brassica napus]